MTTDGGENAAAAKYSTTRQVDTRQDAQETAAGITVLISPDAQGFDCIFKQRYTDFQVNEILPNGKVLHLLEDVTPPKKQAPVEQESSTRKREADAAENEASDAKRVKLDDRAASQQGEPDVEVDKDATLANSGTATEDAGSAESVAAADGVSANGAESAGLEITVESTIAAFDETAINELEDLFDKETTHDIFALYTSVLRHPMRKSKDHTNVKTAPIESKSTRTAAHGAIRRHFKSRLETLTLQDEPGRMCVRAAQPIQQPSRNGQINGKKAAKKQQQPRVDWKDMGGEYLHFTLYKENKDTMEVLNFMACELKIKPHSFSFAGTKDRRGVTVQRVAVHRITKERMVALTRLARGWMVDGFEYHKQPLTFGGLKGNEFLLTLRDVRIDGLATNDIGKARDIIKAAADDLGKRGFMNFYGLQRFGGYKAGTHITGMRMIQGNLEAAVNGILDYDSALLDSSVTDNTKTPKDDILRAKAIHYWREKGTSNRMREMMPRRFAAESNLIQFLSRKRDGGKHSGARDWQGALMTIQRGLRLMYVHAYQSFVWNSAAAHRWRTLGDKAVEGDLVVDERETVQAAQTVDQDGEVIVHASASADESSGDDEFKHARPLTKEEAESGKYSIFDVVLPLPGWDVVYPTNELGTFYKTFMGSEEGGRLDPHDMKRAWKDASLMGGYRKFMARPLDGVSVDVHTYHGEQQLVPTDAEKLNAESLLPEVKVDDTEPEKMAVVLRFQLASSQYATMALRELTKGGAAAFRPDFSVNR